MSKLICRAAGAILFLSFCSCATKTVVPKAVIVKEVKPHVEVVEKKVKEVTNSAETTFDLAKKVETKYASDEDVKKTVQAAKETVTKSHESENLIAALKVRAEVADSEAVEAQKVASTALEQGVKDKATISEQKGQISVFKATIWKQRKWIFILAGGVLALAILLVKPWRFL